MPEARSLIQLTDGLAEADSTGTAVMRFDAPGSGQAHYIATAIGVVTPNRPGALWIPTFDGGRPAAIPASGAGIHLTSIPIYSGQTLIVTVTGLTQGDVVSLAVFGFTGTNAAVMAADVFPHAESQITAGTTPTPAAPPAPVFTLRASITGDTNPHDLVSTQKLLAAGYPADFALGAALYLYYLMILPTPPSANVGTIKDNTGTTILQCPTNSNVPICLPLSGILYPIAGQIVGADVVWLTCNIAAAADLYVFHAVGAIV